MQRNVGVAFSQNQALREGRYAVHTLFKETKSAPTPWSQPSSPAIMHDLHTYLLFPSYLQKGPSHADSPTLLGLSAVPRQAIAPSYLNVLTELTEPGSFIRSFIFFFLSFSLFLPLSLSFSLSFLLSFFSFWHFSQFSSLPQRSASLACHGYVIFIICWDV